MFNISKQDVETINRMVKIHLIDVGKNKLTIYTHKLYMDNAELGRFKLQLFDDGVITINNKDRYVTVKGFHEGVAVFHHPHVWSTNNENPQSTAICLGDVGHTVRELIYSQQEYAIAISVLLQFLEQGFGWSTIKKETFLSFFPQVDKKQQRIEFKQLVKEKEKQLKQIQEAKTTQEQKAANELSALMGI